MLVIYLCQSQCRQYLARLHYSRLKKAAIATQCAWRGRVARRELRNLKMVFFFFFFLQSIFATMCEFNEGLIISFHMQNGCTHILGFHTIQQFMRTCAAILQKSTHLMLKDLILAIPIHRTIFHYYIFRNVKLYVPFLRLTICNVYLYDQNF